MVEDAELLRRFVEENSDAAFKALVERHLNFVHACALRRVGGDAHLAQDVTQQVFTALARHARALARREVLSGWLYTTTKNATAQVVRGERRRQAREQEAHVMNEITSDPGGAADWTRLRPVIDDALDDLAEDDRQAVLLRFFEGRSFAAVGARLRLTENTARMRVDRALDKLHALLARRGVTSTTAALGVALANQAGVAAPAGMATAVTGAALAGASAGAGFMSMTTLQIGLVGAIAVAGAAGWITQARANADLRVEIAALQRGRQEAAQLQAENRNLARAAADVEMLRVDPAEMARLREEIRVAQQRVRTEAARTAQALALAPLPLSDPDAQVMVKLPNADADTALSVVQIYTGRKIVRDPSLGRIVGLIDYRPSGRISKGEAVEALRAQLLARCGIVLELVPDGNIVVKRAAGR